MARALVEMGKMYHNQGMAIQADGLFAGASDRFSEMANSEKLKGNNLPRLSLWHAHALESRAKLLRVWDKRDSEARQLEEKSKSLLEKCEILKGLDDTQRARFANLVLPPVDIPGILWGGCKFEISKTNKL